MTVDQGDPVTISYTVRDPEDKQLNVTLSIDPDGTDGNGNEISLFSKVVTIPSNGTSFSEDITLNTGTLAPATYRVIGTVDDQTGLANHTVTQVANGRITVVPAGTTGNNGPPTVDIVLPVSDAGVGQDDQIQIFVIVSDPNSNVDDVNVTFYFDRDQNPSNDAVDPPIEIAQQLVPADPNFPPGTLFGVGFFYTINTTITPVRDEVDEGGRPLPYYFRVRASDGKGGVVDLYGPGAIRVLGAASDVVDLLAVGGSISGMTLHGFHGDPFVTNRGSAAGSAFARLGDFDFDGIADFAIAARWATPFARTNVGMVYVIYGRPRFGGILQGRYGGFQSLNAVGQFEDIPPTDPFYQQVFTIRGTQLYGPQTYGGGAPHGIASIAGWPDITGDGLPELLVGAPFYDTIEDHEDNDPCDLCTQPNTSFICYVNPAATPPTQPLTSELFLTAGEKAALAQIANTWIPVDPRIDPNNPTPPVFDPFSPRVLLDITDERIISLSTVRMVISGQGVGGPADASVTFTISGQLEPDHTDVDALGNPVVVHGMQGSITITVETDDQGNFEFDTSALDPALNPAATVLARGIVFQNPTPEFPLTVDGTNTFTSIPPSVYDGVFNAFLSFSRGQIEIDTVDMEVSGVTAEEDDHEFALFYRDLYPDPRSNAGSCATTTPAPVNPYLASQLAPACGVGPLQWNDDNSSAAGLSGYLCAALPPGVLGGVNGPTNDGVFVTTDPDPTYQSGFAFMLASEQLVLPLDPNTGVWGGIGPRNADMGVFGQPVGGSRKGSRIRGAWYGERFIYDPESRFGETVDTMPDINGTTGGLFEALVSAPGANRSTDVIADLSDTVTGLAGTYTPGTARMARWTLTDPFGNPLTYARLGRVLTARFAFSGTASRGARAQVQLLRDLPGGGTAPIPGTQRVVLLWNGDADLDGDYEMPEYIEHALPFAVAAAFPSGSDGLGGALGLLREVDSAAAGLWIELRMLDDCTVQGTTLDVTAASIDMASPLLIDALEPSNGMVVLFNGEDFSLPDFLNDPDPTTSSWPAYDCINDAIRQRVGPVPLTQLMGAAPHDELGWARNGGDINRDGVADIACGAPGNDNDPFNIFTEPNKLSNNGKTYVVFGFPALDPGPRTIEGQGVGTGTGLERVEIRGSHNGDGFGRVQGGMGNFTGDAAGDLYVGASLYDFDTMLPEFTQRGYTTPLVDAGFVAVLAGVPETTAEAVIRPEQIGSLNFPGTKFVGGQAGALLGESVSGAGDFNQDGFADLLIAAPGQRWPGARIAFNGNVAEGETITINGVVFEFDTNNSVPLGRVRVDVSGNDANGNPKVQPAGAEAALRGTMKNQNIDALRAARPLSQTIFPDPEPDRPTTVFLSRRATLSVTTTSANIAVSTFTRQGVTYLVFGGQSLLNKTYVLPDDMNTRDISGNRILKGMVLVSAYEKNSLGDINNPFVDLDFEPGGGLEPADFAQLVTFAGGAIVDQSASVLAGLLTGPNAYTLGTGTTGDITFLTRPICSDVRMFLGVEGGASATVTALNASGVTVGTATVAANAGNPNSSNSQTLSFQSIGGIASLQVVVTGATGLAMIDNFRLSDPTPDEGPVQVVRGIGDIDADGFADIILGAPQADFINILEPCNRRRNAGLSYVVYGNKLGLNDPVQP
ncbi:MAG: FG-GAP repeat protein [Phycisphaerae bacterium]|nr:FG-GAP repeat protein [Phycisphaerae bacterium]